MSVEPATQPAYPVGSVDKALRLLLMVAERPSGLRIADAAEALDVAPSTAHRLLQMLTHHGFAQQDRASRIYLPGPTLQRLASPRERIRTLARPILAELVAEFRETVHLATLEGASALIVLSVESPYLLRIGDRTGHSQAAHRTAVGRVLLSQFSTADAIELLRRAGHQVDEELLTVGAERLRTDGFLQQHGEAEAGISGVAVPVHGPGGIEYAISTTYPTGRIEANDVSRLAKAMQAAAGRLEQALRA